MAYKVGTKTRNRKIEAGPLDVVVAELENRHDGGSRNYMGSAYASLMRDSGIQYTTSTSGWDNTKVPQDILSALKRVGEPLTISEIASAAGLRICEVKPWIRTLVARERIISNAKRGAEKLYGVYN